MEITLLRHGALEGITGRIHYGLTEHVLSEEGKAQAAAAGTRLKGQTFDAIYCSPLLRARHTMELACAEAGIDCSQPRLDRRLVELDYGDVENYSHERLVAEYPKLAWAMDNDWQNCAFPGGESARGFIARVNEFFDELMAIDEGNLLVICHGGTIRAALCGCLKLEPEAFWRLSTDYCGISKLQVANGYAVLKKFNC